MEELKIKRTKNSFAWEVKKWVGPTLILVSFSVCFFIQRMMPSPSARESIKFGFNEDVPTFSASVYRSLMFGYHQLGANLMWIRFLQRSPVEKVPPGQYSWVYLDLDSISTLDPDFEEVFVSGGIFTSVIVEDKEGARKLLEKGVQLHPNNWRIRANLAYHYQHELGLPALAATQYEFASKIPGAPWILSVSAASGLAKRGKNQAAIQLLRSVLANMESPEGRKRIEQRIRELEAGNQ